MANANHGEEGSLVRDGVDNEGLAKRCCYPQLMIMYYKVWQQKQKPMT